MVRTLKSLLLLALVLGLAAPALARVVSNEEGKYDGLYKATVANKTQDKVVEDVEIDLEGHYVEVRFPEGARKMKISEIFDRHYVLEITARDSESGDLYILQIKT